MGAVIFVPIALFSCTEAGTRRHNLQPDLRCFGADLHCSGAASLYCSAGVSLLCSAGASSHSFAAFDLFSGTAAAILPSSPPLTRGPAATSGELSDG
ncbi:hypothetical protein HU200_016381 [Digitaria exilis]|uniref:Secreted protein n=1 Tax=Digitaria exilis TaxID=1010633 RepID=A0A835F8T1_9POAL|nr:hypothetical protein HU200_016381 [Digitaria exilis]